LNSFIVNKFIKSKNNQQFYKPPDTTKATFGVAFGKGYLSLFLLLQLAEISIADLLLL